MPPKKSARRRSVRSSTSSSSSRRDFSRPVKRSVKRKRIFRKKSRSTSKKSGGVVSRLSRFFVSVVVILLAMVGLLLVLLLVIPSNFDGQNILFISGKSDSATAGERVIFVEIYPDDEEIIVSSFNPNITAEVMGGYGEYKLGSVYKLLQIDKKNDQYIAAAFSNFLGKGVDLVVTGNKDPQDKLGLMKLFFSNKMVWNWLLEVKGTPAENINFNKIENLESWQDGLTQTRREIDPKCNVAVVNSTNYSGLAGDISQVLENSGVEVVRATNNIWGDEETIMVVNDSQSCLEVKSRVQSVSPVELNQVVDQSKTSQYRADVVLFIGEEFAAVSAK